MRYTKPSPVVLVVVVLSLWTAAPAAATPIEVRRDRSDNTLAFTYESASNRIVEATSSVFFKAGDRVDFFSYVVEREGAPPGRRLKARIALRLNRGRAVRYDGLFRFIIKDDTGTVVVRRTKHVDLLLRPRKGERKRFLRWIFHLPTGSYTAFARFRAP